MKKKVIIIIAIIIVIIGGIFIYIKNNTIPNNYIAVFHGGSEEETYSTYVYKINNGQLNSGFKYINTTNRKQEGSEWQIKITGKGEVTWTDDVFIAAKNNNAYSYVTLPNDDKNYSIEEYMSMFLMN